MNLHINTTRGTFGGRVLAAAILFVLTAASVDARTVRMKLGTVAPSGSSFHKILEDMGQRWKEAPGGGIALTIYPDGARGGEAEMVRHMRTGGLDAGLLTVTGLAEIDESVTALQNMPLMFESLDEVDYIGRQLQPRLEAKLREKGFIVLFWADAGWVRFFSRTPVLTPDDLRRTKLFTWAGDSRTLELYGAAGFRAVPLETSDILPSLQTGLIDAVPMPPIVALAAQVYRPAPHMLELDWAPLVGALVVTERAWKRLDPETRASVEAIAAEAGKKMKEENRSQSERAVEAMKKRGLKVHPMTPELRAKWQSEVAKVWPSIRGRLVPAALFDEVRKSLIQYRAKEASRAGGS